MKISKVSAVYFSATYTTQKIVRWVAQEFKPSFKEYDVTRKKLGEDIFMDSDELLIVGMPVYAGRIPQLAVESLKRFKGNDTPVVLLAVYGNRDYDDALLEMKELMESHFFKVVAAGAFIARHSIFTKLASTRPDAQDHEIIQKLVHKCTHLLDSVKSATLLPQIQVKGNKPYKPYGRFPIFPSADETCNRCGKCARLCPVGAIPKDAPQLTDPNKCISCGRCLVICPQKSRAFRGELYEEKLAFFLKTFGERKEPELIFAE